SRCPTPAPPLEPPRRLLTKGICHCIETIPAEVPSTRASSEDTPCPELSARALLRLRTARAPRWWPGNPCASLQCSSSPPPSSEVVLYLVSDSLMNNDTRKVHS